jgi:hypothetical protein
MDHNAGAAPTAADNPVGPSEFDALTAVVAALQPLDDEARRRIVDSAVTFLRIGCAGASWPTSQVEPRQGSGPIADRAPFSENTRMSVKEFLLEKEPRTDVERLACLAYYLTHYRATPHFKTVDLSLLNTEAAQPKFTNAANSANNAVKMGYLVPSSKGQRQLSAVGERFVRALPDRDSAKAALESLRRKSRPKRNRLSTDGEV